MLRVLIDKYGHVSRERVISIPGVVDVWKALAKIDGDDEARTPMIEEIIAMASTGDERSETGD